MPNISQETYDDCMAVIEKGSVKILAQRARIDKLLAWIKEHEGCDACVHLGSIKCARCGCAPGEGWEFKEF